MALVLLVFGSVGEIPVPEDHFESLGETAMSEPAALHSKTSPIKGSHLRKAVRYLRHLKEIAQQELPEGLQHYLSERVMPATWYPREDYNELVAALVRVLRRAEILPAGGDPWVHLGRTAVEQDVSTIYKTMLIAGDPLGSLEARAKGWSLRNGEGTCFVTSDRPGQALVVLDGYHSPSENECRLIDAYSRRLLEMSGAQNVRSHTQSCVVRGDSTCSWEYEWD